MPELFDDGKYKILRVGNFFNSDKWYYSDLELGDDKYCYEGDLLFAWSCSFGPKIWHGEKTIYHYHIWKLVENTNLVDKIWLYYWLKGAVAELTAGNHGSVMMHMTKSEMESMSITLPPLPVQKRIAAVLGALDDKIELNRKMNKNLEEQAQALFKSWFVDFEPWGGKMPKEWKRGCVGDIAEVNPIRSLKKYEIATCVEMADLSTNCSYPDRSNAKKYNGGMKFKNGDTLMARITPCLENGKAAFVNFLADGEVGFGSTEYITLCSKTEAPNELFYFLVRDSNFVRYATLHMAGSSGRQRVSGAEIAAYAFPLATEKFYRKIKPILETTMRMIAANAVESRKLAETRDALLPKLMSGEIEV